MSEKLKVVYSIQKDLYAEGVPLIIKCGELCRDVKSGAMVCRFSFFSIYNKTVKDLEIRIRVGNNSYNYVYSELYVARDTEFGSSELISINELDAESISVEISKISFTDGSVLRGQNKEYFPLIPTKTLEEHFSDDALVAEYRNKLGEDCIYFPHEERGLWHCSCGSVNFENEAVCHHCNRALANLKKWGASELQNILDKEKRLAAINREAFEDIYRNVEADRKSKKSRNMLYILIAVAIITFIAFLITMDDDHYTQAVPRLEADFYEKL